MRLRPLLILALGACASGGGDRPDAGRGSDAAPADAEGPDPRGDAPTDGPDLPDPPRLTPLLLTEIVLAPTGGELIEIVNPTAVAASLDGYYLADSGAYFRVPTGLAEVDATDFIVKFPPGATIPSKGVITVALDTAANFQAAYGVAPTYSIADQTMVPVATNGVANLTNAGELVALFHWNGTDDLVRDIDLMLAGVPSAANGLIDKSGVAQDGPDADPDPSAYATDARTIAAQPSAPGSARSTKRIALELGHEQQGGAGNGVGGDDETSEQTSATWDTAFTAPTPGELPSGLVP